MHIRIISFLLCIIVIMFSIISCNDNKNDIEDNLLSMQKKAILLPLGNMMSQHCKNDTASFENCNSIKANYRYVVFIDSAQCSPCAIDGLYRWNSVIDSVRQNKLNLSFLFIVSPPKWQLEDVLLAVEFSGLENDIYIDSMNIFSKMNQHLPRDSKYHSFVINGDNKVVIVGNVLINGKIRELLNKLLKSK